MKQSKEQGKSQEGTGCPRHTANPVGMEGSNPDGKGGGGASGQRKKRPAGLGKSRKKNKKELFTSCNHLIQKGRRLLRRGEGKGKTNP